MKLQNILVFDTETTGDMGAPLIYDFGYRIISPDGATLFSFNCLVGEIFTNNFVMQRAFYSAKVQEYKRLVVAGQLHLLPFKKVITGFIANARKHNVGMICAYNIAFDLKAIQATMKMTYYDGYNKKILDKLINQKNKKVLCIWNLACETILNTDEYRLFADEHNLKKDTGNYQTNAEAVYRFITKNTEFVEAHTALADVDIEIEILLYALTYHTPVFTYGPQYNCWQKVQVKT